MADLAKKYGSGSGGNLVGAFGVGNVISLGKVRETKNCVGMGEKGKTIYR